MTTFSAPDFRIRRAGPGDRAAAYAVCLQTGDSGQDASHLHDDRDALGNVYVGAYLRYEPEFAFLLEDSAGVCGYALGALDSRTFYSHYENEWLPPLRARHPAPQGDPSGWSRDQQLWQLYHHPEIFLPDPYGDFPSHLHIDLLPRAQGRGNGRALMQVLLSALRERGSPGIHLAMASDNLRAAAFYTKLGFRELARAPGTLYLARRLVDPLNA
ncbi:MAG: GNAT family N-acetyltransferase [Verrucomicrobia bacterium]|nr:GNAT family N-acetyltransferase [Verrucomicrobiota bacterium]